MSTLERKQKRKKINMHRLRDNLDGWILMLPAVIILYLMVWRPTVMGGIWSMFKMKGYTPTEFVGFRNFVEVVKDTQFFPTLINTVEYVVWSLVIGFLPPLIIAIMLNEMVIFKNGFRVLTYLPALIPTVAALLIWYYMYYPDQSGLLNMLLIKLGFEPYTWLNDGRFTILYIIIAKTWSAFPPTMLLYYASVQSISSELYEAAIIDGAGIFRRLSCVTFPQMSGILLLNFIRQMISVFQIMEEPLAMTGGGPNGASISLGYQLYKYGFVNNRAGHAMALGAIIFFLLIIFTCSYFYFNKRVEENY